MTAALLVLFAATAFAQKNQGTVFEKGTLKELLALADEQDKYLFVDVYATWCGPCQIMAKQIFPQQKVGEFFNKTFVNAKFNAEKGEGVDVAKRYSVKAYPTFLILDSDGEEVGRIVGGADARPLPSRKYGKYSRTSSGKFRLSVATERQTGTRVHDRMRHGHRVRFAYPPRAGKRTDGSGYSVVSRFRRKIPFAGRSARLDRSGRRLRLVGRIFASAGALYFSEAHSLSPIRVCRSAASGQEPRNGPESPSPPFYVRTALF